MESKVKHVDHDMEPNGEKLVVNEQTDNWTCRESHPCVQVRDSNVDNEQQSPLSPPQPRPMHNSEEAHPRMVHNSEDAKTTFADLSDSADSDD